MSPVCPIDLFPATPTPSICHHPLLSVSMGHAHIHAHRSFGWSLHTRYFPLRLDGLFGAECHGVMQLLIFFQFIMFFHPDSSSHILECPTITFPKSHPGKPRSSPPCPHLRSLTGQLWASSHNCGSLERIHPVTPAPGVLCDRQQQQGRSPITGI